MSRNLSIYPYPIYNQTCCRAKNVSEDCMGNCKSGHIDESKFRLSFCDQFIVEIQSCMFNKAKETDTGS